MPLTGIWSSQSRQSKDLPVLKSQHWNFKHTSMPNFLYRSRGPNSGLPFHEISILQTELSSLSHYEVLKEAGLDGMATERNFNTRQGTSFSRSMTEPWDIMHIFKGFIVIVTLKSILSTHPNPCSN